MGLGIISYPVCFYFQVSTIFHVLNYDRCLAHVINLAMQALISTYSKTKHFDPKEPNIHEPDIDAFQRDEVGLIRSITVKVGLLFFLRGLKSIMFQQARSSAKRKERLLKIQKRSGGNALMLLLDMKVRWSSTYVMLKRANTLKDVSLFKFLLCNL